MTERNDSHPTTGGAQARTEAQLLRTQARRALKVARAINDQEAALRIEAYAAELLKRAEAIEREAVAKGRQTSQ